MPWGTYQSPTMQNAMINVGAPGPCQSAFSMSPVQYRASDQGYVMGGANQQNNKPLDGAGGEGHVSHSAIRVQSNKTKAMTATIILNLKEIKFEEFEMRCSLIETGTDAVLRTDRPVVSTRHKSKQYNSWKTCSESNEQSNIDNVCCRCRI